MSLRSGPTLQDQAAMTGVSPDKFLHRRIQEITIHRRIARRCGAFEAHFAMLCHGSQIRLTRREVERLHRIAGLEPVGVRSLADLEAYVRQCKAHYWGVSRETQFLHWLIDREIERCLRAA